MFIFFINAFFQPEMEDGDAANKLEDGGLLRLMAPGAVHGCDRFGHGVIRRGISSKGLFKAGAQKI